MKHITPTLGKMCFSFAIKKAPANCRSENKKFICKFEMHPITQFGCIVSIYGTQARRNSRTAPIGKKILRAIFWLLHFCFLVMAMSPF